MRRPARRRSTSGAGRRSSSPPRSRCRSASRRPRSTPSSSGRSTSRSRSSGSSSPSTSSGRSRSRQREAPLRRDLVLHRDRSSPSRSCTSSTTSRCPVGAAQELLGLRRRAGRARAVVVRAQRRRVLPDDAVPRASCTTSCRRRRSGRSTRYRLSIVHFWSLVFIYIWAGPHHLLYTALPDWAQTLGMVFSSCSGCRRWGGMINGLLTLRGAWDKLRDRPGAQVLRRRHHLLRHGDVRGPAALDQERQRALALHRLDHRPRPRRRARLERLHGVRHVLLAGAAALRHRADLEAARGNAHFWVATIGIVLYVVAMWAAGHHAGPDVARVGRRGALQYPDFVETVITHGLLLVRAVGGTLYLAGSS